MRRLSTHVLPYCLIISMLILWLLRSKPQPHPATVRPLTARCFVVNASGPQETASSDRFVMPAEFEPQRAVLLHWNTVRNPLHTLNEATDPLLQDQHNTLLRLIEVIHSRVQVIVLVQDAAGRKQLEMELRRVGLADAAVQILSIPFESIWIRDFGPGFVRSKNGKCRFVNVDYMPLNFLGLHPQDNTVAATLADELGMPIERAPIALDWGNILSNGSGLILTSSDIVIRNVGRGYGAREVADILGEALGATQVVMLQPLSGEPTGHVDVFATFTDPQTVVINQLDPAADPVNARILDENARLLSSLATADGPLRVVRIPMPPAREYPLPGEATRRTIWPSFTNVLFANQLLVVPTIPNQDPSTAAMELAAVKAYQRLLPNYEVVCVNSLPLLLDGGGFHCASMNLHRIETTAGGR